MPCCAVPYRTRLHCAQVLVHASLTPSSHWPRNTPYDPIDPPFDALTTAANTRRHLCRRCNSRTEPHTNTDTAAARDNLQTARKTRVAALLQTLYYTSTPSCTITIVIVPGHTRLPCAPELYYTLAGREKKKEAQKGKESERETVRERQTSITSTHSFTPPSRAGNKKERTTVVVTSPLPQGFFSLFFSSSFLVLFDNQTLSSFGSSIRQDNYPKLI